MSADGNERQMVGSKPDDKKQEDKSRFRIAWLSEGLLIAVLPVSAYLLTFTFESAYCSYFSIPLELISLSMTTILNACLSTAVLVVTFFFIAEFLVKAFSARLNVQNNRMTRWFVISGIFAYLTTAIVALYGLSTNQISIMQVSLAGFISLVVADSLLRRLFVVGLSFQMFLCGRLSDLSAFCSSLQSAISVMLLPVRNENSLLSILSPSALCFASTRIRS